jgi:hypothetical protein
MDDGRYDRTYGIFPPFFETRSQSTHKSIPLVRDFLVYRIGDFISSPSTYCWPRGDRIWCPHLECYLLWSPIDGRKEAIWFLLLFGKCADYHRFHCSTYCGVGIHRPE